MTGLESNLRFYRRWDVSKDLCGLIEGKSEKSKCPRSTCARNLLPSKKEMSLLIVVKIIDLWNRRYHGYSSYNVIFHLFPKF
jgi:hypothetical protein